MKRLILASIIAIGVLALITPLMLQQDDADAGRVALPDPSTAAERDIVPKSANPIAVRQRMEAQARSEVPSTEPEPEHAPPEPDPFQDIGMPMEEIAALADAGSVRAAEEMVVRIELCQLPDLQDRAAIEAEVNQARTTHILFGRYIHDRDELESELDELITLVDSCSRWQDPDGSTLATWRDRAAELGSVAQSYMIFDPPGDGPIDVDEYRRLIHNVSDACTAKDFGTLAIAAAALDDQPMIFAAEMMRQSLSDADRTGGPQTMTGALYGAELVRADDLVAAFEAACAGVIDGT